MRTSESDFVDIRLFGDVSDAPAFFEGLQRRFPRSQAEGPIEETVKYEGAEPTTGWWLNKLDVSRVDKTSEKPIWTEEATIELRGYEQDVDIVRECLQEWFAVSPVSDEWFTSSPVSEAGERIMLAIKPKS